MDVHDWTFARFRDAIAALPAEVTYDDVVSDALRLHAEERFEVFYAPFEHVERRARIVLVGLAPGRFQARNALQEARDLLAAGADDETVLRDARLAGSFSGPIRARLVHALDLVGLPGRLGIATSGDLFGPAEHLVHRTAAVRYPVFVRGVNWTGLTPPLRRAPVLIDVVRTFLAPELAAVPDAAVLPLGRGATEATDLLVHERRLDAARVVPALPHPSPANGHFVRLLDEAAPAARDALARLLP